MATRIRTDTNGDTAEECVLAFDGRRGRRPEEARAEIVAMGAAALPALMAAMTSTNTQVRWEAAKALGELALPESADPLLAALEDEDGGVRWVAADGLIAMGAPCLEPLLHRLMLRSESVWLREGAHHVLTSMPAKTRITVLPVIRALEGVAPAVGVLAPTAATLRMLGFERAP